MTDAPKVSVVVASRHRPMWLRRCLMALRQLDYSAFEVVVVADPDSMSNAALAGLKGVAFDEPNLSRARNLGIAASAGEICAFVDDDAVPEPMWLAHHVEALAATGAAASVGFVRGRNGITFQSRVTSIDHEAETHVEPDGGMRPFRPKLKPGRALKLVGTNMAVRREVLAALGGFDPAFAWFLDDSDISLRLAAAGHAAVAAPLAEVHHGFAASARRSSDRVPLDLYDIGRSSAVFFRRHCAGSAGDLRRHTEQRERARLLAHMVDGGCEPRDVGRLMRTLERGWRDGETAELPESEPIPTATTAFKAYPALAAGHDVLAGRLWSRPGLKRQAGELAASGRRVSVFSFSLTARRHHVRYLEPGFWLQTGGQFGRAMRSEQWLRWCRFAYRQKVEMRRVAKVRGIREITDGVGQETRAARDIGGASDS